MQNKNTMIDFNGLCELGFPPNQSRTIIRQSKALLVSRGYGFYNGKRVGLVPLFIVSEIIALPSDIERGNNDK